MRITFPLANISIWTFPLAIAGILLNAIGWAFIALILAWPVQLLWDWLMPALFSLPLITFWQAFGLQMLLALLFKMSFSMFHLPTQ